MRIRDVLTRKARAAETIAASAPLVEAIQRFSESKVRALAVMEGGRLAGILAMRDALERIAEVGAGALDEPVSASMTREVRTVGPESSTEESYKIFLERAIHHLPVLENGELVGLVTPFDVLAWSVSGLEHERELLMAYIQGDVA